MKIKLHAAKVCENLSIIWSTDIALRMSGSILCTYINVYTYYYMFGQIKYVNVGISKMYNVHPSNLASSFKGISRNFI